MQSINLNIESDIYEEIKKGGIDIQKKFNEFLAQFAFVDDGYPSIGTQEAKQRVAEAVEHYRRSPEDVTAFNEQYWDELDKIIDEAK